jgi:hypothetical protein
VSGLYLAVYPPTPRPARIVRRRGLGQASAPGVPAGSVVAYNATFTSTSNPFSSSFYSVTDVLAAVVTYLQTKWGLSVTAQSGSGTLVGTPTISLQVQTSVDYAQLADLKSILDGSLYNAAGAQVTSSSIAITKMGSTAATAPAAPIGAPSLPADAAPPPVSSATNLPTVLLVVAGGLLLTVLVLGRR